MVSAVSDTTVDGSEGSGEVDEETGETSIRPSVQYYVDQGVISEHDAKQLGFLSNPENKVLLALLETARQRGFTLELHRIDTQTGTFEFKIKSADERFKGAIVSLTLTTVAAVGGVVTGFTVGKMTKGKNGETSGQDNMGSLAGGAFLQVFKSAGETAEAGIGVNAAEYQAFAEMFEQNYQAMSSDVNKNNDGQSAIISGLR